MSSVQPLGARVLVQRLIVGEQKLESGLVLPERSDRATYKSEVVAVGNELSKPVSVGDIVLTTVHVGDLVQEGQEFYHIVHEEDLLAVISR